MIVTTQHEKIACRIFLAMPGSHAGIKNWIALTPSEQRPYQDAARSVMDLLGIAEE